jgi:triacylglycerol lipase
VSNSTDPRLKELGNVIQNEFAVLRKHYDVPKHPVILAHGLLGFDEMHLISKSLPGIQYWRGIREALSQAGVKVITATVPPSGCIERRAERLAETIKQKAQGKSVNIIACVVTCSFREEKKSVDVYIGTAWGMAPIEVSRRSSVDCGYRGLDSRYMISRLKPPHVKVVSLTTIATPHRGSAFADYLFDALGRRLDPSQFCSPQMLTANHHSDQHCESIQNSQILRFGD